MLTERFILLSFNVEEFDAPLEYGETIRLDEQLTVGHEGLKSVRQLLEIHSIPTTLFTTANFASHFTDTILELSYDHEIASHTLYHSFFRPTHLRESRIILESIIGEPVTGIRIPGMHYLDRKLITDAGYRYDSSLNPTYLQRRYQEWAKPCTTFWQEKLLRIPVSVTPWLRIPLSSECFKRLPYSLYLKLVKNAIKSSGYVCLHFHPWEFCNLKQFILTKYYKETGGDRLFVKFHQLIKDLKKEGRFITMNSFYNLQVKQYWITEN